MHIDYIFLVTRPKCHIAHHFNHVDIRNAMMPLKTVLALYNTNPGTNGFMDQKGCIAPAIFIIIDLRNAMV